MKTIHNRNTYRKNTEYFTAFLLFTFYFLLFFIPVEAQSTNENYPTAVTTNEINGKILARDIGDARLTSYFYYFNGNQGDVFINVQTSNFNGDIDVFTADNLRPLTKITIYADLSEKETGRVVYLRKPEKLVLRIEGRSPNDDPATFKIKFAGSFAAVTNVDETNTAEVPKVKNDNQSDVRVNSVGTIIEVKPKPTPTPKVEIARNIPKTKKTGRKTTEQTVGQKVGETVVADEKISTGKTNIIIEKNPAPEPEKPVETVKKSDTETAVTGEPVKPEVEKPVENKKPETEKSKVSAQVTIEKTPETTAATNTGKKSKPAKKPVEPNPLENIRLIVLFKDGTKIERPMSDVLKVSVDKGILTVISKDGAIGRYSILDVTKMTIE